MNATQVATAAQEAQARRAQQMAQRGVAPQQQPCKRCLDGAIINALNQLHNARNAMKDSDLSEKTDAIILMLTNLLKDAVMAALREGNAAKTENNGEAVNPL